MTARAVTLALRVPAGWHAVPSAAAERQAWIHALASTLARTEHDWNRLARDFAQLDATVIAHDGAEPSRLWLAAVPVDPDARPVITAVGWAECLPAQDLDEVAARLRADAHSAENGVLTRQVEVGHVGGRRAVLVHDLAGTVGETPTGALLHERFLGVIEEPAAECDVVLEFSTSDLSAYDDIVETGRRLLAGVEVRTEELP